MTETRTPAQTPTDAPTDTVRWIAAVSLTQLRRRRKTRVDLPDRAVAVFLVGDQVFAMDDHCVHRGRSLSKGVLWQDKVVCPGHQWMFDPETGRADEHDECQPVHAVRVIDDVVHVSALPVTRRPDARSAP